MGHLNLKGFRGNALLDILWGRMELCGMALNLPIPRLPLLLFLMLLPRLLMLLQSPTKNAATLKVPIVFASVLHEGLTLLAKA